MSDNSLLDANRKLKRQVQNKHADIARLRKTLKRVVKEARRINRAFRVPDILLCQTCAAGPWRDAEKDMPYHPCECLVTAYYEGWHTAIDHWDGDGWKVFGRLVSYYAEIHTPEVKSNE